MNIVQVLVPKPFDAAFDYAVPANLTVQIGDYVKVPFGRQTLWGVVWSTNVAEAPPEKIKSILQCSELPPMQIALMDTIRWTAGYTMSPLGSVLAMSMSVPKAFEPLKRPRKPPTVITHQAPVIPSLNSEQQAAVEQLTQHTKHHVTVIDGVTGSGKTAVYAEHLATIIATGKQALVLLPEIALTTQFVARLSERFGAAPTLWHSQLTPATRRENWKRIVNGEAKLIMGARSAVFLPYANLGLIVVDEEHEAAYKQEDGVPYHGRDMAVLRGKQEDIPVTLVSASPSMETVWNMRTGKYGVVHLHERFGGATMPDIELIDMRAEQLPADHFISEPLKEALASSISAGKQSLLFLNRRGFAPLTLCRKCGFRFESPEASAWMVLHKKGARFRDQDSGNASDGKEARSVGRASHEPAKAVFHGEVSKPSREQSNNQYYLKCHHSGYTQPLPSACPQCGEEDSFVPCGPGVERLEQEVQEILPQARIVQMTSDTMANPKEAQKILAAVHNNDADIIIGTQLVAKGHHFANLTLVGVVDADLGLDGGNVRAGERTYQLLHQVAGRAGREASKGRVLVQSFQPEHGVMHALQAGARDEFVDAELGRRKRGNMPPYSRMAAIILSGLNEQAVQQAAKQLARTAPHGKDYRILGPVEAPIYKLRNRYRWRFLIMTERDVSPQKLLRHWLANNHIPPSIQCKIDIDPQSLM